MNFIRNKIKQIVKYKQSGNKLKEQNQQDIKTGYTNEICKTSNKCHIR